MKKLALGALCAGLLVALGACGGDDKPHITLDAGSGATTCDPLKQTGCPANEKCTWLIDAIAPNYVGHLGCAPIDSGAAAAGAQCQYKGQGTDGYDNCDKGLVCGNYRGGHCPPTGARACTKSADCNPGELCNDDNLCATRCLTDNDCNGATCLENTDICKPICDQLENAGNAACDTAHACVIYSGLFSTGDTTPPAAGVCDLKCDPFADNDFDGSGTVSAKTGTTCAANQGCYGYPSYGTAPKTAFTCTRDINRSVAQPLGLRHRVQCTEDNKCAAPGPKVFTNSCNQGYLPLLRESTTVSTTICVALCDPLSCYNGNCGTQDVNRVGRAPNRCNANDRLGMTFNQGTLSDPHPNGEECEYLWRREYDTMTKTYLLSDHKDTVGICFDHSQYQYDSDGDNTADTTLPPCGALVQGFGAGSDPTDPLTFFGAADLGCVTSDEAGVMVNGKMQVPDTTVEKWRRIDMPRALYHRVAAEQRE
jgi:hypothetical protein